MQAESLISILDFCGYHQLELTFVQTLEQRGLVELITIEQALYVRPEEVARLEKFVRLHQELAIHADDLDIVSELLDRVENLQQQINDLHNRLAFYES